MFYIYQTITDIHILIGKATLSWKTAGWDALPHNQQAITVRPG